MAAADYPADSLMTSTAGAGDSGPPLARTRGLTSAARVAVDDTPAALWVCRPAKAAKVATDIAEGTVRDLALPLGRVDVKACAVRALWSA